MTALPANEITEAFVVPINIPLSAPLIKKCKPLN
jgi:hypothetical protein